MGNFVKKMCTKVILGIFHPGPILFYVKCLTDRATYFSGQAVFYKNAIFMILPKISDRGYIKIIAFFFSEIIEVSCIKSGILICLLHFSTFIVPTQICATKSREKVFDIRFLMTGQQWTG